MRCEEVIEQLSEYLEKLLDPAQSGNIDGHLASCPRCSGELADLAECRRLVAALPAVEPPVGFTTRVMAHIREGAEQPAWWQRLFLPLRTKLPLQATALLFISVLSVYLLQKENPQEKLLSPMASQSETDTLKKSNEAAQSFTADGASQPSATFSADAPAAAKAAPRAEWQQTGPDEKSKKEAAAAPKPALNAKSSPAGPQAASEARSVAPAAPQSAAEDRASRVDAATAEAELPPTPSRPISGAIGVMQPAAGRAAPASPSMDAILQERATRAPLPERARSAPAQPTSDIEIVLRRHPQPANEPRDNAEPLRAEAERRLGAPNISGLAAPRAAAASEPLWRTIPAEHYEQFKRELATQGTIISEVRTGAREPDGQPPANQTLTIKVTFVAPEAAR